jgi:hypothetical protein
MRASLVFQGSTSIGCAGYSVEALGLQCFQPRTTAYSAQKYQQRPDGDGHPQHRKINLPDRRDDSSYRLQDGFTQLTE